MTLTRWIHLLRMLLVVACSSNMRGDPTNSFYLKEQTPQSFDSFGREVAISGNTLMVGAGTRITVTNMMPTNIHPPVRLFERGGGWERSGSLFPLEPLTFDGFGSAMAIDGDTIVVGAAFDDRAAQTGIAGIRDIGAAYVFVRAGTNWVRQAYLKPHNPKVFQHFGSSVAIQGDTIVVGAPGETHGPTFFRSGAAYVFERTATNWTQTAYLTALTNATCLDPGTGFGHSLDISGDTIVVRSGRQCALGPNLFHTFVRTPSGWQPDSRVETTNTFRHPIAINGDEVFVSDPDALVDSYNSGSVSVYRHEQGQWNFVQRMTAVRPAEMSGFGISLDVEGDVAAIGFHRHRPGMLSLGAVQVFRRQGGQWIAENYFESCDPDGRDGYGALALSGNTLVVGAYGDESAAPGDPTDNSLNDAGAVYVYALDGSPSGGFGLSGNQQSITNGANLSVPSAGTDFGLVPVDIGSRTNTFSIANTGVSDLNVSTPVISGPHAAEFALVATPAPTVAPGQSTTFAISFDPDAVGQRQATVSVSHNASSTAFEFTISGTGVTLPVITRQPMTQLVAVGEPFDLSIEVVGNSVTIQWRKNDVPIAGALGKRLPIASAQISDAGLYDAVVWNPHGVVISDEAEIGVFTPGVLPRITSPPSDLAVPPGSNAWFHVTATGQQPLLYHWRIDGVPFPAQTEPSFFINNAQFHDQGEYDVIVSNVWGSVTSRVARLTIEQPQAPAIVLQPAGQVAIAGRPVTMQALASGVPEPEIRWFKETGTNVIAIGNVLQITPANRGDAGQYRVRAVSTAGAATSDFANLQLRIPARLAPPLRTPSGHLRIRFNSYDGVPFSLREVERMEVQMANELSPGAWIRLLTPVTLSNGLAEFQATATSTFRFYRIIEQ